MAGREIEVVVDMLRAKSADVDASLEEWEEMIHVWHAFASLLPEGRQAIERIGEYLGERFS